MDRVRGAFRVVLAHAAKKLPWLKNVKVRHCMECDRNQKREWRLFAHSGHEPLVVCFAAAANSELTDVELIGMVGHELGHIVGEELGFPEHKKKTRSKKTPIAVQCEADWISNRVLGIRIKYNERTIQEGAFL